MTYILRLKVDDSRVDAIHASSLEEANYIFMTRKQMSEETFNKLYEVTEDEQSK